MKYYCIKQHDITDCGAACLATIAQAEWFIDRNYKNPGSGGPKTIIWSAFNYSSVKLRKI
jgi:hypothetical protein